MGRMLTLSEATGRFLGLYGLVALACLILSQRAGVSSMDVAAAYILGVPALGLSLLHLFPKWHRWALRITHRWGIRLLFAKLNFGWFVINLLFIADGFETDILQMDHTNEGLLKGFMIFAAPAIYFVMLFPIGLSYRAQRIRREALQAQIAPKHRQNRATSTKSQQKSAKAWGGPKGATPHGHLVDRNPVEKQDGPEARGVAWWLMLWGAVATISLTLGINVINRIEVIPTPEYTEFVQRYLLLLLLAIFVVIFLPPLRRLQRGALQVMAWVGAIPLFFFVAAWLLYDAIPAAEVALRAHQHPEERRYKVESISETSQHQICLDLLHVERAVRSVPVCLSPPSGLPDISAGDIITVQGAMGAWGQRAGVVTSVVQAGTGV